jgi:hypothetical protein
MLASTAVTSRSAGSGALCCRNASSLLAVLTSNPRFAVRVPAVSWPRYEELREQATSFSSVGLSAFDNFTLTGNGDPQQLNGPAHHAVILSDARHHARAGPQFHGGGRRPERAGGLHPQSRTVAVRRTQGFGGPDDRAERSTWEVVGIMPPRLTPPFAQTQVFSPRVFEVPALTTAQVQAGSGYAQPIARLKPGVSIERAQQELAAISRASHDRAPGRLDANNLTEAQLFVEFLVGGLQPTFRTLAAAVAFVLLIACANVASLFL